MNEAIGLEYTRSVWCNIGRKVTGTPSYAYC